MPTPAWADPSLIQPIDNGGWLQSGADPLSGSPGYWSSGQADSPGYQQSYETPENIRQQQAANNQRQVDAGAWWMAPGQGYAFQGGQAGYTNPTTQAWDQLVATEQGNMPLSEAKRYGLTPLKGFSGSADAAKGSFMSDWGWTLPVAGFLGAGALGGAGGGGAAVEAGGFGGWNALGEGAYGATGLGETAGGLSGMDAFMAGTGMEVPGAAGAGYGLPAEAATASGTGIDALMGTGGPVASGSSSPSLAQWFSNLASNPAGALKNILGSQGGGSTGGSWTSPSSMLSLASGIYGLYNSEEQKKLAKLAMERGDPFASSRGMYGDRLNALMADPSSITKTPGYDAGLQAVERRMAAQGFNGSGNMMTALSKYGGDFYNQEVQRLMQLSGANATPGAGTATGVAGYGSAVDTASKALASLGYGTTRATGIPMPPAVLQWMKDNGISPS